MTGNREGGCQCGAVRFAANAEPLRVTICHCRMCQKASGNLFGAFAAFPTESVSWSEEPARFRSSSIATRAFCSRCGTPLSWERDGGETVSLCVGAFDDPASLPATKVLGIESRLPWLCETICGRLPEAATTPDPAMENRQRDR